jgi:uncharacterized protein (TIGR04255 family)
MQTGEQLTPVRRHYDHAPIVEAVVEIQCEAPKTLKVDDLLRVQAQVATNYPQKQEVHELQISVPPTSPPNTAGRVIGYRFTTADGRKVLGTQLSAFSFSQLAPYDRWETMRAEAYRLWLIYKATATPVRIVRVGVRYINRIDIPTTVGAGINLDEYFETSPRIAPTLPQNLTNYFMRLQIPNGEEMLLITETSVQPAAPNVISTILDIDVFVQRDMLDESGAWEIIDRLRERKNEVFEACITDRVRDLIK